MRESPGVDEGGRGRRSEGKREKNEERGEVEREEIRENRRK